MKHRVTTGLSYVMVLGFVLVFHLELLGSGFWGSEFWGNGPLGNGPLGNGPRGQTDDRPKRLREIRQSISKLKPIHKKQAKPQPGDWLAEHKEPGQTYQQYSRSRPITLTRARNKIYVQPLGDFSEKQKQLVKISSEFLSIYFNCEVKILDEMGLDKIADEAKRVNPDWGQKQILTTHILYKTLAPALPEDAAALIAFTPSDLWPGQGWNFVFGQASYRNRVGVWSFYRHGKVDGTAAEFGTCLRRTLKVASHETGHMFSIQHCIHYQCNMQGSNSLAEADRQPMYLCPECHAKVMWATGCDPVKRFTNLVAFCKKYQLKDEQAFFQKSLDRLR